MLVFSRPKGFPLELRDSNSIPIVTWRRKEWKRDRRSKQVAKRK